MGEDQRGSEGPEAADHVGLGQARDARVVPHRPRREVHQHRAAHTATHSTWRHAQQHETPPRTARQRMSRARRAQAEGCVGWVLWLVWRGRGQVAQAGLSSVVPCVHTPSRADAAAHQLDPALNRGEAHPRIGNPSGMGGEECDWKAISLGRGGIRATGDSEGQQDEGGRARAAG